MLSRQQFTRKSNFFIPSKKHVVGRGNNRYGAMTCQVELFMVKLQLDALYSLIRGRARGVEHTWRIHPSQGSKGTLNN